MQSHLSSTYLVYETVGARIIEVRSRLSTEVLSHSTRSQAGRVSKRVPRSVCTSRRSGRIKSTTGKRWSHVTTVSSMGTKRPW